MNREVIVVIPEGDVQERAGSFKNDQGEQVDYATRKQPARLESGGFAYPYDVKLEKDQPAFKPGRYTLALDKMIQVNKGVHAIAKYPVLELVK